MPTFGRPHGRNTCLTTSPEDPEQLHQCALRLAAGELPAGWDIVPGSSSSRVAVNNGLKVYYKEFPACSPFGYLLALQRGSRATRARPTPSATPNTPPIGGGPRQAEPVVFSATIPRHPKAYPQGPCSRTQSGMEVNGYEPMTPCFQSTCSPS